MLDHSDKLEMVLALTDLRPDNDSEGVKMLEEEEIKRDPTSMRV